MKEQIYTLADLQAMANDDLSALAAELRGLKRIGGDNGGGDWLNEFDDFYDEVFIPTTDRNQSGELMEWFMAQNENHSFSIIRGRLTCRVRLELTEDTIEVWREQSESLAQLETVAFCAAMLAMAGRLQ